MRQRCILEKLNFKISRGTMPSNPLVYPCLPRSILFQPDTLWIASAGPEVYSVWTSLLNGDKCILCGQVYSKATGVLMGTSDKWQVHSMGTSVFNADKSMALWGQVYSRWTSVLYATSVLYGNKCTLWGQVYSMGTSVLYGDKWYSMASILYVGVQVYSMGTRVLYGKSALWEQMYSMGTSVCTLWGQVYSMGTSVL